MIAIGHRGAAGHAPENTLASIRKAFALGARAIEVDVYFVDGHLVVFHDDTLERTTNGTGNIMDKSFNELRQLDAGGGEKIPTLEEVLDVMPSGTWINIELKGPGTAAPVAACIAHYRQLGWGAERFLVSSFSRDEIATIRAIDNTLRIGALAERDIDNAIAFARQAGAYSIHPAKELVTPALVQRLHADGFKVYAFTVNTPADIAAMRDAGVDGVFSDFPERVTAG